MPQKETGMSQNPALLPAFFRTFCISPSYAGHNAFIGIRTVLDEDKLNIEVSLNLPCVSDEEVMLDIHDKCNMLTLMTAAPFQVTHVPSESSDLSPSGDKIKHLSSIIMMTLKQCQKKIL